LLLHFAANSEPGIGILEFKELMVKAAKGLK
jgi:hypothetical protein